MSIDTLIRQVEHLRDKSMENFRRLLEQLELDPAWIESMIPEEVPVGQYHRNVLACCREYEIIVATWPAGIATLIHDHGCRETHGMVRVLKGEIYNREYQRNADDELQIKHRQIHRAGDLFPVPRGLVHTMGNNLNEGSAMSLHIYAPGIADVTYWDCRTLEKLEQQAVS